MVVLSAAVEPPGGALQHPWRPRTADANLKHLRLLRRAQRAVHPFPGCMGPGRDLVAISRRPQIEGPVKGVRQIRAAKVSQAAAIRLAADLEGFKARAAGQVGASSRA